MFINQEKFRKLTGSITKLDYHWAQYINQFPHDAWGFRYRIIVESYCYRDKKRVFQRVFQIPFINQLYLSKATYHQLRRYVKIDRLLRTSLKKKQPQKRHRDKTYQTEP